MKKAKQTIVGGTIILMVANVLVKLIGAAFKIPLARLIGKSGMGMFGTAYTLYTFLFVVATAGFPVAVSKMVAEAEAKGKAEESRKILRTALTILGTVGLVGTLALYFYARPFSSMIGNERAELGIMYIAPAVFCVAIMAAFRGYFQGKQNMYPTAISEVIEALGKLVIGYVLAAYWLGSGLEKSAAGAVFGVSCGTFLGALYIVGVYLFKDNVKVGRYKGNRSIMKELIMIALPITLGAAASSLTNVADLFTVMTRLQTIPWVTAEMANDYYGMYTGFAVPLFNLPLTLVVAISMSIVPGIAGNLARNKHDEARGITQNAIRMALLLGLPCAIGLLILAEPILLILYGTAEAATLLKILSVSVALVAVVSVANAILQSYGHVTIPVINMLIGGIVKVLVNYFLIPMIGINAAPIATLCGYSIIVGLDLIFIKKYTGARFSLMEFIIKPAFAVGGMAVAVLLAYNGLIGTIGTRLAGVVAVGVGVVFYIILVFKAKCIRKEDIILLRTKKY